MILLIDNYDSFTYNLYQYIGTFNDDIKVVRNDNITIEEIEKKKPERIVISPGPKRQKEDGIIHDVIKKFAPDFSTKISTAAPGELKDMAFRTRFFKTRLI